MNTMNIKEKIYSYSHSIPIQSIVIAIVVALVVGCNSKVDKKNAVIRYFGSDCYSVKHTTIENQFVARREDGSVWEVIITDDIDGLNVSYCNCLFEPVIKMDLPSIPIKPLPVTNVVAITNNVTTNETSIPLEKQ